MRTFPRTPLTLKTSLYERVPPRLTDGTPIPRALTREICGPDGKLLEAATYLNR